MYCPDGTEFSEGYSSDRFCGVLVGLKSEMKIVLNTTRSDRMGARVCVHDLYKRLTRLGVNARLNDWDHYYC